MATELDKLLPSISPDKVLVETFNRANEAINTFPIKTAQINKWEEYTYCMGEFLRHIDRHSLGLFMPIEASPDFYWSLCVRVLVQVYGSNGEKVGYEMARTGKDGGVCGLLRAVAMHVAEGYAKTEIQARVNAYLDSLTVDQEVKASAEYLDKFGRLLPSEMTEASAARIRADFHKVLVKHPWLLMKIRDAGR